MFPRQIYINGASSIVIGVCLMLLQRSINVPFKDKMCEFLEKTIVIWWDPLHLINRAHIRGKLCIDIVDLDDDNLSDDDEQTMEISDEFNF